MKKNLVVALVVVLAACGGSSNGGSSDDTSGDDASGDDQPGIDGGGSGSDGGIECTDHSIPAAADRTRYMVVAHPFAAAGGGSKLFEVLTVSTTGEATRAQNKRTFELEGRASYGNIVFTPDGKLGLVALDEIGSAVPGGRVGVFSLAADGTPTVIEPGFHGEFYAGDVVMDPSGTRAYVLDQEFRQYGGGIHVVNIACDGHLTDGGLIAAAKLPGGLVLNGDHAVVMAADYTDDMDPTEDAHLLSWNATAPTRLAAIDAYGNDMFTTPNAALNHDKSVYLALNNALQGGNRVAVLGVTASALTAKTVITDITDPQGIATSPFGNVAVVSAFQDNAIYILDDQGTAGAWRKRGTVTYGGGNPMLPSDIATVHQGTLDGHMWVAENVSIRHLQFTATGGNVTDLGSLKFTGPDADEITGAIGIQP